MVLTVTLSQRESEICFRQIRLSLSPISPARRFLKRSASTRCENDLAALCKYPLMVNPEVYNKDQDMVQMLLISIVKAYRFMDKELKMQVDVDCFCSGTTAVTMVKQAPHEKDEFVVLATDWIWDVLTNEEVVEIVAKAPTRCTAGRALVEATVRNWRWKFPTSKVDDCSVVCLFLDSKPDKLSIASFSVDKHISNGLTEPDTTSTSTPGSGTESPELNGVEESTESTHS
ncbi:hypothetical protein Bca52824_066881 [Brassica carinata]|uniref:PPM-type phosphatase domain-containing protein n=1 Tax=Brassica carinata TaxID=52824 RepID=A0A8X7UCB7_BRACI|nr:hypothetical protein Bca52824_066881 [Brassica carinata]